MDTLVPRAIQVGLPPEVESTLNHNTRFSYGVAVPEADRDVHSERIYFKKKFAIAAIPVVDEDGQVIEFSAN